MEGGWKVCVAVAFTSMKTAGSNKLQDRARELAEQGADPFRVEALHRARRFKRSWLEMAEALSEIKMRRLYEVWGYSDLYAYCGEELLMKRGTVEKLTGSYRTIERYAPELLKADGDDAKLPSFDSVDYFARAIGERENQRAEAPPPEVINALRDAVFDEARPVAAIRKEFHSTLYPKNDVELATEHAERTRAQVRRLLDTLPTVAGLDPKTLRDASGALERLAAELTMLAAAEPQAQAGEAPSARPSRAGQQTTLVAVGA